LSAILMPGAPVADATFTDLTPRIARLVEHGITPGLGTILVGDDGASAGYIRMKQEKAAEVGMTSPHVHLPADAQQADLVAAIRAFNDDPSVDAMLVQHPAPPQIDYEAALLEMDPDKDVDGLHPVNLGRLVLGVPGPVPCTPAGIEALLAHYEVPVAGREVVVLGRGFTLGRPLALLYLATRYDRRTSLSRELLVAMQARFGREMLETVIRRDTALREAAAHGMPVRKLDPASRGAFDHDALARELSERLRAASAFPRARAAGSPHVPPVPIGR